MFHCGTQAASCLQVPGQRDGGLQQVPKLSCKHHQRRSLFQHCTAAVPRWVEDYGWGYLVLRDGQQCQGRRYQPPRGAPCHTNEPGLQPLQLGWEGAAAAAFLPPFQPLKVPCAVNLLGPSRSSDGSRPCVQVPRLGSVHWACRAGGFALPVGGEQQKDPPLLLLIPACAELCSAKFPWLPGDTHALALQCCAFLG